MKQFHEACTKLYATKKLYKAIEKNYKDEVGRMRNVMTLDAFFDRMTALLSHRPTMAGGEYSVYFYSDGSGYAASCKYKKTILMCHLLVKQKTSTKFSVKAAVFSRVELYPREVVTDKVLTYGKETRSLHIAKFIGEKDSENPCYIRGLHTFSYDEVKKAAKPIWERFCENIFDFEI
jgi:hypothetical protein